MPAANRAGADRGAEHAGAGARSEQPEPGNEPLVARSRACTTAFGIVTRSRVTLSPAAAAFTEMLLEADRGGD